MIFGKYKKYGAYHWKEYDDNTIYGQHVRKLEKWIKEDNILDLGAGDGLITHRLQIAGKNVIAIDDNMDGIALAKERGVEVIYGSAYNLRSIFPLSQLGVPVCDCVLMADVIEHLEFPDSAMYGIDSVLRYGGTLYITTPPRQDNRVLHDEYHYKEYTPDELIEFIEGFGYVLAEPTEVKFERIYAKFIKE